MLGFGFGASAACNAASGASRKAMKADRSQQFNLFQLIGNLFSELIKSFVSLFVLSVLAAGVIYILWLVFEEITA